MSRITDPQILAALSAETYRLLILAELDFPSGMVRVHSGVGEVIFNTNTYLGVGQLGKISTLEETAELRSSGFTLELSGIDPALLAISLNDDVQGRDAKIWLAFLDENHQIISDPVGPWLGRMDNLEGELGETATLQLNVENRMADWERPRIRRYTDADQQAEYPGDKGFEFVNQMQEKEIPWGPQK